MFESPFPCSIDLNKRLEYVGYNGPSVLNIGAGINPISGAVNADLNSSRPGIQKSLDVLAIPWEWKDNTFDKVVAFHVIEHIPIESVVSFLKEIHRVLKLGGALIVECPNILGLAKDLLDGNAGALRHIYSGDRMPGDAHRWGYDPMSLVALASACGFFQCLTFRGTDYHREQMATVRLEAVCQK